MRYFAILLTFAAVLALAVAAPASAADTELAQAEEEQGFFDSIWKKLKRMVPRRSADNTQRVTAVMGVRGNETTESALKPHWAGDVTESPSFREELARYEKAQHRCRSSDEPGDGIDVLRELNERSEYDFMRPTYTLALAACHRASGDVKAARNRLREFVARYPDHPMAAEAKAVLHRQ